MNFASLFTLLMLAIRFQFSTPSPLICRMLTKGWMGSILAAKVTKIMNHKVAGAAVESGIDGFDTLILSNFTDLSFRSCDITMSGNAMLFQSGNEEQVEGVTYRALANLDYRLATGVCARAIEVIDLSFNNPKLAWVSSYAQDLINEYVPKAFCLREELL